MKRIRIGILLAVFILSAVILVSAKKGNTEDERFITYIVNPSIQQVRFYWKDDQHENFRSIERLRLWLQKNKKELVFAMNGGMYKPDNSPQGLYIEQQELFSPLDSSTGSGNFYMQPNGIFYITKNNIPVIVATTEFQNEENIQYATQSGPMLVINGKIHPAFIKGSQNINIRNGVGILPHNKIVFAMSKEKINFYDFAMYFKNMGCTNALYLDGLVSRTYLPEKQWMQTDGNFGVIIGITKATD